MLYTIYKTIEGLGFGGPVPSNESSVPKFVNQQHSNSSQDGLGFRDGLESNSEMDN